MQILHGKKPFGLHQAVDPDAPLPGLIKTLGRRRPDKEALVWHEKILRCQHREIGGKPAVPTLLPALIVTDLVLVREAQGPDEFSAHERVLAHDGVVGVCAVASCRSVADCQHGPSLKCPVQEPAARESHA
ncbi:MAG: hypothetical protein V3S33_07005 [Gammaproteobacteria bacterium]